VTYTRFAVDEQRCAVLADEFNGIDTIDVKLIVFGFEEILDVPDLRHK
jgi:hypothetical protein